MSPCSGGGVTGGRKALDRVCQVQWFSVGEALDGPATVGAVLHFFFVCVYVCVCVCCASLSAEGTGGAQLVCRFFLFHFYFVRWET